MIGKKIMYTSRTNIETGSHGFTEVVEKEIEAIIIDSYLSPEPTWNEILNKHGEKTNAINNIAVTKYLVLTDKGNIDSIFPLRIKKYYEN